MRSAENLLHNKTVLFRVPTLTPKQSALHVAEQWGPYGVQRCTAITLLSIAAILSERTCQHIAAELPRP